MWSYDQMVYVQTRIFPGEWLALSPMGFCDTNRSSNLGQTTEPYNNQQQKRELAELWTLLNQQQSKMERSEG